jgi:hypothetical protein
MAPHHSVRAEQPLCIFPVEATLDVVEHHAMHTPFRGAAKVINVQETFELAE